MPDTRFRIKFSIEEINDEIIYKYLVSVSEITILLIIEFYWKRFVLVRLCD